MSKVKIEILDEEEFIPYINKIEILEEDVIPTKLIKKVINCVIPGCKNKGKCKYDVCKKHYNTFKFKDDKPDECVVCLESLSDEKYPLRDCGHWVHYKCVILSGKKECPLCRYEIKMTKDQVKELNTIKNRMKKENEEDERKEIMEQITRENSILTREGDWMDRQNMFNASRRFNSDFNRYMGSETRTNTLNMFQELMGSGREDASIFFEIQHFMERITNRDVVVRRRTYNFLNVMRFAVEREIRELVLSEFIFE